LNIKSLIFLLNLKRVRRAYNDIVFVGSSSYQFGPVELSTTNMTLLLEMFAQREFTEVTCMDKGLSKQSDVTCKIGVLAL